MSPKINTRPVKKLLEHPKTRNDQHDHNSKLYKVGWKMNSELLQ